MKLLRTPEAVAAHKDHCERSLALFWAPFAPSAVHMGIALHTYSAVLDVPLAAVDVTQTMNFTGTNLITKIPTIVIYKYGKEKARYEGAIFSIQKLTEWVAGELQD